MGLFAELKRRNVIRVAGVYIVVGWILVQVATALEESIGLPAWFDGLIVALLLIGLPIAVIFAWAFELTPEGVVKTEAVPEGESITAETGRRLDFALAIAIVALVIVIIWQGSTAPTPDTPEPVADEEPAAAAAPADASVAVLPFADMSAEGDQGYFSDGLSEEILNLLVKADAIDVVSRTSSFQFKDTTLGIPQIAAELNVRHVVEGSVRKSGETIRVTAQLIDAVTDRHLWSDTYDRPLTVENLFEIQDDVANSIFEALSDELGLLGEFELHARRTTENVDAYTLFLQARALYEGRRDLDVVDDLLTRAIEIDPAFSVAWEYRAGNQVLMRNYGYSDLPLDQMEERGLDYANHALTLDPNSATALATIGHIQVGQASRLFRAHRWVDIFAGFNRALEIDPRNASALNWRGLAYEIVGDVQAALADFQRCVDFEPYYVPCIENLQWNLADQGQDEEALEVIGNALDSGVSKFQYTNLPLLARTENELAFKAVTNNVTYLRDWRRHDELYDAFRNLEEDHPELAQSVVDFFAANPGRDPWLRGYTLMALGHFEPILEGNMSWGETGRRYRQSPEFNNFMKKNGILEYWLENGFPQQCRPLGADDFECD
jgi:TolB-like protein/Tfp pilus assembly protein PilF